MKRLTEQELAGYRQWLAELDQEAREPGGDLAFCDTEVWQDFDPAGQTGRQVYESFTDEELLEILSRTVSGNGYKPSFEEVYFVYRQYLRHRFKGLDKAKEAVKRYVRRRREEERWPPDWPSRVSAAGLAAHCEKLGQPLTEAEGEAIDEYCRKIMETAQPPADTEIPHTIQLLCTARRIPPRQGLQRMGIPALDQRSLLHMRQYWKAHWDAAKAEDSA